MGARAIDCLGLRGPQPIQEHIVGSGLILFSWKDFLTKKDTTMIFNSAGRYLGSVLQPKLKDPETKLEERCENLMPIIQSYDS